MKLSLRCRRMHPLFLGAMIVEATVARGEQPQPVEFARFDAYSEGPVFDYDGNLFVSHGDRSVARITPDGRSTLWLDVAGPNGHKVLPDGTHLLCVTGAVLHLDADGTLLRKASTECRGTPLGAPNDLTLAPGGGFYFTDPAGSREAPVGNVHYVDTDGTTHLVAGGLWVPNGLVLSTDGRRMYVAETVPNRILWFAVNPDGTLGPVNVFADLPSIPGVAAEPDGLAVDVEGNLYVAHLGMSSVQVLNLEGQLIRSLPAGNYDASNLVFGGEQRNQLYVTGSIGHRKSTPGRVYRIDLDDVRGVSSLIPQTKEGD